MVVFVDEVTKILCNSLFTFFTEQGKTGKNGTHRNTIFGILTKNEVMKICNEPGIYVFIVEIYVYVTEKITVQ